MSLKKHFSVCSVLLTRSESAGSLLGSGPFFNLAGFFSHQDPDIRQKWQYPDPDSESGTSPSFNIEGIYLSKKPPVLDVLGIQVVFESIPERYFVHQIFSIFS